jgi:hypothetical protein
MAAEVFFDTDVLVCAAILAATTDGVSGFADTGP